MRKLEEFKPVAKDAAPTASDNADIASSIDHCRRHILVRATATVAAAGVAFAAWPFLASLGPSARAKARGAPVRVDIRRLEPGEQITVIWRGRPVWVLRRTQEMLEHLSHRPWLELLRDPDSEVNTQQPAYAKNPVRSIRPEIFVAVASCTHLGCVPLVRPQVSDPSLGQNWMGGYFCPCHGSRFDFAGRVTKDVPAPTNLMIPPYRFLGHATLEIGVDYV